MAGWRLGSFDQLENWTRTVCYSLGTRRWWGVLCQSFVMSSGGLRRPSNFKGSGPQSYSKDCHIIQIKNQTAALVLPGAIQEVTYSVFQIYWREPHCEQIFQIFPPFPLELWPSRQQPPTAERTFSTTQWFPRFHKSDVSVKGFFSPGKLALDISSELLSINVSSSKRKFKDRRQCTAKLNCVIFLLLRTTMMNSFVT